LTGNVKVFISCAWTTQVGSAIGHVDPYYGPGTAPANGAAATGTLLYPTADVQAKGGGIGSQVGYSWATILSLTPGTTYWFDIATLTQTPADPAYVQNVSMILEEK
jgi:hypothetical protein